MVEVDQSERILETGDLLGKETAKIMPHRKDERTETGLYGLETDLVRGRTERRMNSGM